ncbi:ABC transporter substrate-binding protein [Spelaeicoccus albus]|uniref:Multiple sugar transport system substrate-binding protein n=1 Tax=Spelaeicoccus albus TaxID=1280376 RepID=A0A7Z0AB53_9MICO|nr:sugar ABC transporter substrate-binding protein [Spelaeicoccus albus]NYI66946.1 multiple sugar transport system substrate-binding protein [Spelaeicoccus albus]
MKRATFLRGAAAMAAAATVSSCSSEGSGNKSSGKSDNWEIPQKDPTATITVVGQRAKSGTSGMDPVLKAFHKAHPTITVKYQQIPFKNLNSVLASRITDKTGNPDVFWTDQPRVAAYATKGYLADLTDQFGDLTSALVPTTVDACKFQGKLWSLPLGNSSQVLYYNPALLEKAGVKPPSADPAKRITWQQLAKDAKRVQDKGGAKYGMLFGQPNRYYQLEPLPASDGGGIGAKGKHNLTVDVNNPQWVETMNFYGSLFDKKISPKSITPEQTGPTFIAGHTGYFWHTQNWVTWITEQAKFEWGGGLTPVWEGGTPYTPTGSWGIGLNPYSKNKEAAAIFMKWLAIDGVGGFGKSMEWSIMPANKKGVEKYLASEPYTGSAGGKAAAKIIDYESKNTAQARVATVGYVEFETLIEEAFSDISNGTDAKKALDTAQQKITSAWKKYQ